MPSTPTVAIISPRNRLMNALMIEPPPSATMLVRPNRMIVKYSGESNFNANVANGWTSATASSGDGRERCDRADRRERDQLAGARSGRLSVARERVAARQGLLAVQCARQPELRSRAGAAVRAGDVHGDHHADRDVHLRHLRRHRV